MKSDFVRKGSPLVGIVEGHVKDAGGDFAEGSRRAAQQVCQLIEAKKVDPERMSILEALMAFCPQVDLSWSAAQVAEAITQSYFPKINTAILSPKVIDAYQYNLMNADQLVSDYGDVTAEVDLIPGFGTGAGMRRVHAGEQYPESDLTEKYVENITAKFGNVVSLTWEAIRFDKTGQLINRARDVGYDMGLHRHTFIVQRVQDVAVTCIGASASTALKYKGSTAAIYSADHSAIDGQTNSNLNTSSALTYATVQTAITALQKQLDEGGNYVPVLPTHIIVPVAKWNDALQLVRSQGQYDSANRADNVLNYQITGGLNVFSSPILDASSATTWYIGAPARQFVWGWSKRPEVISTTTNSDAAMMNDIVLRTRISYGGGCCATDYRYMAKSTA